MEDDIGDVSFTVRAYRSSFDLTDGLGFIKCLQLPGPMPSTRDGKVSAHGPGCFRSSAGPGALDVGENEDARAG